MATINCTPASAASRMASPRERRRHEDHGGVGSRGFHRFRHAVEDREPIHRGAALFGGHAAHHVGAVLAAFLGMEKSGLAGDALGDESGVLADQNCSWLTSLLCRLLPFGRPFFAPSSRSAALSGSGPIFRSLPCLPYVGAFQADHQGHLEARGLDRVTTPRAMRRRA